MAVEPHSGKAWIEYKDIARRFQFGVQIVFEICRLLCFETGTFISYCLETNGFFLTFLLAVYNLPVPQDTGQV